MINCDPHEFAKVIGEAIDMLTELLGSSDPQLLAPGMKVILFADTGEEVVQGLLALYPDRITEVGPDA